MSAPHYIPGDFYRICDVCGFQRRASQTFKRWDGLMVCAEDWEPQHDQDFVRGIADLQTVPDPRPEPAATIIGPLSTSISADAAASATTIAVDSTAGFAALDKIGVTLNDGNVVARTVQSVSSPNLTLTAALGGSVSAGNVVTNYTEVTVANIG